MLARTNRTLDQLLAQQLIRTLSGKTNEELMIAGSENPELVQEWLEQIDGIQKNLERDLASCRRLERSLGAALHTDDTQDLAA